MNEIMVLDSNVHQLNEIVCADYLKVVIPYAYANLIICDPPYNINYTYDIYEDRKAYNEYMEWAKQWLNRIAEQLALNGSFWLIVGDNIAADLDYIARHEIGFKRRHWCVWHYTFGQNCKSKFTPSHTHLLHYTCNSGDTFTFNADAVKIPSARQLKYNDKRAKAGGRIPDDVWDFSRVCGTFKERIKGFPCQLPEALIERIIKVSSNPDDIVLDPMCGSATVPAVAKRLGRKFIGVELSPNYCDMGRKRLEAVISPVDVNQEVLGANILSSV